MWKRLTILTIAIVIAVGAAGQSDKTVHNKEQHTSQTQPLLGMDNPATIHKDETNPNTQNLYTQLKQPEWWLVIAAFSTLFAIWLQVHESAKATKEMRHSIKVQEAGMGQWVDVEPIGCYIETPPAGKKDFPFTINLRFEVMNNTAYTFNIHKIVTKICMMPGEVEIFTVQTNVTLSPNKKSRNQQYAFYIPTQLITEEWFKNGTIVTINGDITFKNCLGIMQSDYFGGLYQCGQIDGGPHGMFKFMKSLGIVPERRHEKEQTNNTF